MICAPRGAKVYCVDLQEWLNFNEPVSLPAFLVSLLSGWVDQVGTVNAQRTPAERLITVFTKTRLIPESIKLDAAAGPIKGQIQIAMQSDPDFRRSLEVNLRQQRSSIVLQAHDFVAQLKTDLCPNGEKCVLLADSIEKVAGCGDDAQKVDESVQQRFIGDGSALKLPGLHGVYSVSPFMLQENHPLPSALGTGDVVTMPSVHVFQRNSSVADADGVAAVANWSNVASPTGAWCSRPRNCSA